MTVTADESVRAALQLDRDGRVSEAILAYEQILARWPALPDVWYNLAVLQRKTRQLTAALGSYQQALARGVTRPEEVHLNCSVIYTDFLGQHAAAELELKAALAINPFYVAALFNLGNLCEDLGRRDEACALFGRILTIEPHFEALARLANLQPVPLADRTLITRLSEALRRPDATAADRASLGFALGRLLDAAGEYAPAFAAYAAANRDSRASAPAGQARYDRRRQEQLVDRLIGTPIPVARPAPGPTPAPIFICGMYRSGSTLVEQLLGRATDIATGGELDFLPRAVAGELAPFPETAAALPADRLAGLAERYRRELATRFPAATRVTDKRPDNFLNIGLIKALFPDARIVHTTRAPLDNCLSIFFLHLDHRMEYALDLMDIGHYFREYRRLMSHWKQLYGADIFDLSYDALVRAPDSTLAGLFGFLGVTPHAAQPAATANGHAIKTASVWQARQPLYQASSGRSRHYVRELAELQAYLGDLVSD
jgi:tetratricopeptide (TPR) repeat protein